MKDEAIDYSIDYSEVKKCIEWICSKVGKVTSEEEVERLCHQYFIRVSDLNGKYYDFIEYVKNALFQEPVTLVHYPEKLETPEGTLFYLHGVRLNKNDVERARKEMVKSRRFIDSRCIVYKILKKFFNNHGKEIPPFTVFKSNKSYYTYFTYFSLIEDVFENVSLHIDFARKINDVYVIVVLTEETPIPFIKFFRKYSETFRKYNILLWVADVEREFLNPFIGYPPEKELISRFKNPEVATKVESLWRAKVRNVD